MSLQKQIRRNVERQNDKLLGRYGAPYTSKEKDILARMVRNGITAEDLKEEFKRGRQSAYEQTAPAVMTACYSAVAITLAEDFGFTSEQILSVLAKADERITMSVDNDELAREAEEKARIRFFASEGIDRVVQVE